MNSNVEKKIQKLVSRFFEKAGSEVVTSEIVNIVAYEKQFNSFTGEERKYICLEAISRLEGEESVEYAKEIIEENGFYKKRFNIFRNKNKGLCDKFLSL